MPTEKEKERERDFYKYQRLSVNMYIFEIFFYRLEIYFGIANSDCAKKKMCNETYKIELTSQSGLLMYPLYLKYEEFSQLL